MEFIVAYYIIGILGLCFHVIFPAWRQNHSLAKENQHLSNTVILLDAFGGSLRDHRELAQTKKAPREKK